MTHPTTFAEVLEAGEQLDADAQAELVAVLRRRLAERGRERVAASVEQARRELVAGQCLAMTAAGAGARGPIVNGALSGSPALRRDLLRWLKAPPETAASIEATPAP